MDPHLLVLDGLDNGGESQLLPHLLQVSEFYVLLHIGYIQEVIQAEVESKSREGESVRFRSFRGM